MTDALENKVFNSVTLTQIDMPKLRIEKCDFVNVTFVDTDFSGLHFNRCQFEDCIFKGCTFAYNKFFCCAIMANHFEATTYFESKSGTTNFKFTYMNGNTFDNASILSQSLYYGLYLDVLRFNTVLDNGEYINKKILNEQIPTSCPSNGAFTAWKVLNQDDKLFLARLEVPEAAERTSGYDALWKARASVVIPRDIVDEEGKHYKSVNHNVCFNMDATPTVYEVNKLVYPDSYDPDRDWSCAHGIHFFQDKKMAMLFGGFKFKDGE